MTPSHPTRQLGKDGPRVTALGWGAMGLSTFYGPVGSDEERFQFLDHVYASGQRFWDTSDMYADSETLLGKWFAARAGRRDDIFLATKGGIFGPTFQVRSDPEYMKNACNESLKRLGVSTIDLYYCHRVDQKTPVEKTVEAMADLKREGKIRYLGLSEVSAETVRRAHKIHPISAVQLEYSPFATDAEDPRINLIQTCRELGIAIVAYSPLGRGLITGKYKSPSDFAANDMRSFMPKFSAENLPRNLELVEKIGAVARVKGCSTTALTLAWLMAQGDDVIPIPGSKSVRNFDENMLAMGIEVTKGEDEEVREAVDSAGEFGGRMPDM
ncbi:hypothetical protein AJ79_02343 [Helicocarpus griseus UAMH5409]|uniref:NADP-dependent oxidoreductase domain-containing protein n=1 Tax=Helicocarpus griseus UAMH5409 TaxID=1447875 RepID=A0A2B7Y3E0_9EURO|nr:hypothetical protein AJ79_02343 [Helicocarpus griseus UAMH5409]